jgi:hypothetical protein
LHLPLPHFFSAITRYNSVIENIVGKKSEVSNSGEPDKEIVTG